MILQLQFTTQALVIFFRRLGVSTKKQQTDSSTRARLSTWQTLKYISRHLTSKTAKPTTLKSTSSANSPSKT